MNIDYKQKYMQIKQQWQDSLDVAFRLGFEQGSQQATMQAAQQQQADQAAMQQGVGPGENAPTEESESPEAEQQQADQPPGQGSELDQHIQKLESMLGKSELSATDAMELRKTLNDLKAASFTVQMKKSAAIAKKIGQNLKPKGPIKFSKSANANLNPNQKQALSLQEKIVTDMFKAWEDESSKGTNDIMAQLAAQGIIKG